MLLQPSQRILFLGDSVTDCDRNRTAAPGADAGLGQGYVRICQAMLQAGFPGLGLKVINRGISGNRVYDLEERLRADVLEERPNVVTILIGINDTWQRYGAHQCTSPIPEFTDCYRRILTTLRDELDPVLIIGEPFVLPVPEDRRAWREDLDPRIQAVRELAREFGALLLPLDGIFAKAATRQPPEIWLPDGVHPSAAGHGLIARAWLVAVTGRSLLG